MRRGTVAVAAPFSGAIAWRRAASVGAALLAVGLCVTAVAASDTPVPQRVWMLLLIAPLLEESVFRAGLHEALLRHRFAPLAANLATALIFGLAHALVRGDAAAFAVVLPALLIGWVYGRTRRLRDCVALHAAMNAVWLLS